VRVAAVLLALIAGCGGDAEPPLEVTFTDVGFAAGGLSDELEVEVPDGMRSMTIVATGADDALYALGGLVDAGGTAHVDLPDAPIDLLRSMYYDEQVGELPGAGLHQSSRLGTFTQIVPNRPGWQLVPGPLRFRILTDQPATPITVTVLFAPDDGARQLHVNIISVSDTVAYTDEASVPFVPRARELLASAGIELVVDQVLDLDGTGLETISDFNEPQESPGSMSAMLARAGRDAVSSDALNVFMVDGLPFGVAGLSLGTPGPPVPSSYYWGVIALHAGEPAQVGRTVAHEIAHFIGLGHVENRGISGTIYPDPLDDTNPGTNNLMEGGSVLTEDQSFVLQRSPLLRAAP
jgi:hypothetical protein